MLVCMAQDLLTTSYEGEVFVYRSSNHYEDTEGRPSSAGGRVYIGRLDAWPAWGFSYLTTVW